MPVKYPYMPSWMKAQAGFVPKADKLGASKDFTLKAFEKLTAPVDKTIDALDKAIKAADLKKCEKAYLEFLKEKKTYKAKIVAAAKKDALYSKFSSDLNKMLGHLDEIEGEAEIDFPKAGGAPKVTLASQWSFAKKKFEAATGKKKPSSTTLGLIRDSSGISKCLVIADKAAAKGDATTFGKAYKAYKQAKNVYLTVLVKHLIATKQGDDYKVELQDLKSRLENIEGDMSDISMKLG